MLGRLEMDVDKCIDAYSDLAATVFGEKLRSIPFSFKGDITARFDSKKLESAIHGEMGKAFRQEAVLPV